ncbi:kynureninase [Microtetraspora sp. NBRC 13810]|uniref:kynureninase n=1 Tax=Microtetraspora sp. NBRC 13810 TaxID=3030990 RepID=UPI002554D0F3|nr:kynureninase [Microtetraspora sp. NBRC 13810]GLW09057.1 kynureninase [Microtetraspora sp. NBRC 13810]
MTISRADCAALDEQDPLRDFRDEFVLPEGVVYLVGNSLGAPPKGAAARVARTVEREWGHDLVGGWNAAGWWEQPLRAGDRIAPLIGAGPGEVVAGNTTSIAIFQTVAAAVRLRPGRRVIVADLTDFPTDGYIVQNLAEVFGHEVRDIGDIGNIGNIGDTGALEALDQDVAVVLLSEVNYRTGARLDVGRVTAAAHAAGALMVWDLCHSAGAYQVDVSAADFAVGCTYKYLNGGPGAPAFLYVNPRHHGSARNVLSGWYAHAEPFAFEPGFRPADGVRRFGVSTPHVLSFAGLDAALDIWDRVDLAAVRAKSVALTSLFIELVESSGAPGLRLATPRDPAERGSQVSFHHADGYPVMRALIDRGVHGDFRAPDILRFGFAPLYLRYVDVFDAAATFAEVLHRGLWDAPRYRSRLTVT